MSYSVRSLSTGEMAVFDDAARQLFLLNSGSTFDAAKGADGLHVLVANGEARSFDQATLDSVSQALSKMVLLDSGGTE